MRRAARVLLTLLSLAAAGDALAYVRSTTQRGQPGAGLCLWWRSRQVTYRVNATSILPAPCGSPGQAEALIASSLASWGGARRTGQAAACTDFALVEGAPTTQQALGSDGTNLVVFRKGECTETSIVPADDPCRQTPGACAGLYNCWEHDTSGSGINTIALTTVTFDSLTGEILDADMELHGWDGLPTSIGTYFTCQAPGAQSCTRPPFGQTDCTWIDLGAIATHEAGHMLGLDHVCQYAAPHDPPGQCDTASTMTPTFLPGDTSKRALSQDDVAGVCGIYPAGAPTSTCVATGTDGGSTPGGKSGGCGSGSGSAGLGALGAVALLWLWRALRTSRRA